MLSLVWAGATYDQWTAWCTTSPLMLLYPVSTSRCTLQTFWGTRWGKRGNPSGTSVSRTWWTCECTWPQNNILMKVGQASVSGTAGSYALSLPFLLGGSWPSRAWLTGSERKRSTRQRKETPYIGESIYRLQKGWKESRNASQELDTTQWPCHAPQGVGKNTQARIDSMHAWRPRLWKEHSLETVGLTWLDYLYFNKNMEEKNSVFQCFFHIKVKTRQKTRTVLS